MPFDFTNKLNWDLVTRSSYASAIDAKGKAIPIPPASFPVDRRILAVGVQSSKAKPNYYVGAWLSARLLASPSSLSIFPAVMELSNAMAPLNQLTIFQFPEGHSYPYLLVVKFPKWISQADIEVWKYSGDENDPYLDKLNIIESKLP